MKTPRFTNSFRSLMTTRTPAGRRRAVRPELERCEARNLLSVTFSPILAPTAVEVGGIPQASVGTWKQIGGRAGTILAGSFGVVATDPATGNLFHYLNTPNQWAQIGGPGATFAMDNGGHLYGLSPNKSAVYQYTGNGRNNQWRQIGGPASQIYAGAFGVVATYPKTGNLFHYLNTPNQWAQIGGPGATFAMDNGDHLYGLAPNKSAVYQYTGNGRNNQWRRIGGPATQIYAGTFGVVATYPKTGDLFHYLNTPNQWAQIGGPGAMFTMDNGAHLYGLAPNRSAVYQYTGNGRNNQWIQIGGPATQIDAGPLGVLAIDPKTGNLWMYS